jgi:homoserine kinase
MAILRVFAPATISNLGPGFDILGCALYRPGDTVEAEWCDLPGVTIGEITGDGGQLPHEAARNSAAVAASAVQQRACGAGAGRGIRLHVHKGMPLASGLGSSGASAAAGAVAANVLLGNPLPPLEVVQCAVQGERAACGASHADNVAPSVLGGFVLVRSYEPLDIVRLPVPDGLFVAVVHPHCEVSTAEARRRLVGRTAPLADVVANCGNLGALVAALHQGDLPLLGRSIDDRLVEPVRAAMIPGYLAVKKAAMAAGALGCSISGSGPSVFALSDAATTAAAVARAMRVAFRERAELDTDAWVGPISREGARVVA